MPFLGVILILTLYIYSIAKEINKEMIKNTNRITSQIDSLRAELMEIEEKLNQSK